MDIMVGKQDQAAKPGGATQDSGAAPAAPPCAMVIFGAAGDLTKRLVVPALYNLVNSKCLPKEFRLIGVDHTSKSADEWRDGLTEMINQAVSAGGEFQADHIDQAAWHWLTARMSYLQGDFEDSETFRRLGKLLADTDKSSGTAGNHLFYLAVADRFFGTVVVGLGAAGLVTEQNGQWRRVVIEKPFGYDLPSAKALNAEILKTLKEHQIYRIDHFLGKETVQNIMALRFANGLFEPLWNRHHIDHIQITAAETIGVEHRGKILRENRRAARHGSQPHVPVAGDDGDGAADLVRCRRRAYREGRGDRRDPSAQRGGGVAPFCARPI